MHSGCKCHLASRCHYFNGSENNWRKPKPRTEELRRLLTRKPSLYNTMVGKSCDNRCYSSTAEANQTHRFIPFDSFMKCKNKQDSSKDAGLSNYCCDMSYNSLASVDDNRNQDIRTCGNSLPITATLQDNLVGLLSPTAVKCGPKVIGLCCKVHECPSVSKADLSPPKGLPYCDLLSRSYASAVKQPIDLLSEPVKPEMPKACYSLTVLPKSGSNGLKCGTAEVEHSDPTSKRTQKAKPARFSALKELVGMTGNSECGGETTAQQEDPVATVSSLQGPASSGKQTCLNFSKLSPVKQNAEIALSPNIPLIQGCGNLMSEPVNTEMPKSCSLTVAPKPGSNGLKCGKAEVKHSDAASNVKPARFCDLVEFVGISSPECGSKTTTLQGDPMDVPQNQGLASAGQLTCLVGEIEFSDEFSDLSSPEVSPMKLSVEIAMSPKIPANLSCGNRFIAFLMGQGAESESSDDDDESEVEDDTDSDWEIWDKDEQPENQGSVQEPLHFDVPDGCSRKDLEDLVMQETSTAKDAQDFNCFENCSQGQQSPDRLTEINRKWLQTYDSDQTPLPKKVSFASDDNLVVVHEFESYNPKGPWEEFARDRCRFQRKISDVISLVIEPILGSEHRDKVYRTRILPWIEQQQHCDD